MPLDIKSNEIPIILAVAIADVDRIVRTSDISSIAWDACMAHKAIYTKCQPHSVHVGVGRVK